MRRVALVLSGSRVINKRTGLFVESLRDSGFDPVVVAVPRRRWETSGIEDSSLVGRQGWATLRSADSAVRAWSRPGLIVPTHWLLLPVAILLKLVLRVRVIYDEHDHYEMLALEASGPDWVNGVRSWVVGRVHTVWLPHVDLVTCIHLAGGRLKHHLESHARAVVELHNYPSQRWGRADIDRVSDGSIAIVYIGGIWEVKGCSLMLDAFMLLSGDESLPPTTLHVFGRGDAEIERRLEASPGVTFHGYSAYGDIVDFLVGHDCVGLVLLDATPRYSLVSTNCRKLHEYLAAGVCVLATDVGEIGDILAEVDGGWTIVPGFDAEMLADKLRQIVAEPHEVRRRGDAAASGVRRDEQWWEGEWRKVEESGVLDVPQRHSRTVGGAR